MDKTALITGANGFVGTILAQLLADHGWQVRSGVLPSTRTEAGDTFGCDIADPRQVSALLEWAGPVTHVFHLAAVTFLPASQSNPARTMEVNLNGTIHLTRAVREHAPKARFLYVGSAAVYGAPNALPIAEYHPLQPNEPYAISKAAADAYCDYLSRSNLLDVIRVRAFNHSGPGQSDQFVLSSFAHQIASIEAGKADPVIHVGNVNVVRDFLHVDDVVRAYEALALEGRPGEAYNVCSGRAQGLRDALDQLLRLARVPVSLETDPDRIRRVDIPEVVGSCRKIVEHTGWRPKVPFERILQEVLDYWRQRESATFAP